jgi:hypothetical protein
VKDLDLLKFISNDFPSHDEFLTYDESPSTTNSLTTDNCLITARKREMKQ